MRVQLEVPVVLRRVRISGPAGAREIEVILDTGAVYTVIAWDGVRCDVKQVVSYRTGGLYVVQVPSIMSC